MWHKFINMSYIHDQTWAGILSETPKPRQGTIRVPVQSLSVQQKPVCKAAVEETVVRLTSTY